MKRTELVTKKRDYRVINTKEAKKIAHGHLICVVPEYIENILFGLPEVDDRFHIWRVPLTNNKTKIGEVVIDAKTSSVLADKTTKPDLIISRLTEAVKKDIKAKKKSLPRKSSLKNSLLICGDSLKELKKLPEESINLIFTSPPYYNAKPEYSEYSTYQEYLDLMRKLIKESHRVLSEGRFFVINVSPVLLRRASRSEASKRIAVPFDLHRIFVEEGFDFVDDIHWVKPDGAGWAFGRGRRFAADRNPLQYKPVPVTEYVLVYRKKTDKLIDWNIRNHPDQDDVLSSKISDDYEKTNIWKLNPSRSKIHPATFPEALSDRVVKYYSFKNDFVLDPFGGSGTTAKSAIKLDRKFVLIEIDEKYVEHFKGWLVSSGSLAKEPVDFVNTDCPEQMTADLELTL